MAFHRALVQRKYRLLFSPKRRGVPGPKGPSAELVAAILAMKQRNPRFGCRRIAQQLSYTHWVMVLMDQCTRRIVGFAVQAGVLDRPSVCRMINRIVGDAERLPRALSSDHDPLFEFQRWKANLRVLEIAEVKTVPYVPLSHPFIERLVGTLRREFLDHVPSGPRGTSSESSCSSSSTTTGSALTPHWAA